MDDDGIFARLHIQPLDDDTSSPSSTDASWTTTAPSPCSTYNFWTMTTFF